jgi:tRNA (guanine-N7-)-methyltransferase
LPKYGIAFSREKLSSSKPLVLEIGSGMGECTVEIARAHPEADFVAVEVHGPGVGSLLNRIQREDLSNLRVVRHDALEVLEHMVADGSLTAIHLFFPDPWPKKRHHKRRLLKPAFVAAVAQRLVPGGALHIATDWEDYAHEILATCGAEPRLVNSAADFSPRPDDRPLTKFEARGLKLGHRVWDVIFVRT